MSNVENGNSSSKFFAFFLDSHSTDIVCRAVQGMLSLSHQLLAQKCLKTTVPKAVTQAQKLNYPTDGL